MSNNPEQLPNQEINSENNNKEDFNIKGVAFTMAILLASATISWSVKEVFKSSYPSNEHLKVQNAFIESDAEGGDHYYYKVQKSANPSKTEKIGINEGDYVTFQKDQNKTKYCLDAQLHGFNSLFVNRGITQKAKAPCKF